MEKQMVIRLAELPIRGDWNSCMDSAVDALRLSPRPDVMVLPELFTIGFDLEKIEEAAITPDELETLPLAGAAGERLVWVIGGSFPVKTGRGILNTLPVYNSEGCLVHTTEKSHLFRNMKEDTVFSAGRPSGVFGMKELTAGAAVCYDLRFPELFRDLSIAGAGIIFIPAQWPEPRIELFRSFLRARSGEAQVFTVGCNLGGEHMGVRFNGGGGVSSPSGDMIGYHDVAEHIRDYQIDFNEIDLVRAQISCLADRRPEVYGGGV